MIRPSLLPQQQPAVQNVASLQTSSLQSAILQTSSQTSNLTQPKFVSKKDPRLRRQQQKSSETTQPIPNQAKDLLQSKDQLMDNIIKNKSNLSLLVKPEDRLSLEDENEIESPTDTSGINIFRSF